MDQIAHTTETKKWHFKWENANFFQRINNKRHELALRIFTAIVLAHWAEHLVQAFQVYALGWPLKEARGLLGIPFPKLVSSEGMHYAYALVMLVGLWVLRRGFVGRAAMWWSIAIGIQFWHHFEHFLLQAQVIYGSNFFGAPVPISIIQFAGFLNGADAAHGFGGILTAPGSAPFQMFMLIVRRVEVHLFYNTIVFIPMVVAMAYHLFPSKEEAAQVTCSCAWHEAPPRVGQAA